MKRLACIFGRHRWTIDDDHGAVCSRCGKLPRERRDGAGEFGENFSDESSISRGDISQAPPGGAQGGGPF